MASTPKPTFEVIRKDKVYDQVARKLEQFILQELKPGDKLPSERELALSCKVSRSSIRDAMRRLELMGLVEPRQGAGTIVRQLSPDALVNPLTAILLRQRKHLAELLEVRRMIEPPIAARAAQHITPEQLAHLEEILRRQSQKLSQDDPAIEEDSEFHYAIATAADNSVLLHVIDVLMDLLRESRERNMQVEGRPQKSFAGHKRIFTALCQGDAKAAEAAMCQHLDEVTDLVLKQHK
ncbi:MAG: FadR family transcriptional regulator [Acidobacteriia bacterium]|nr:FadR family transcriptional regulator [Terriglobia bacterium]